jgi:hypothetical protein
MTEPSLLIICLVAFLAVIVLLSVLAGIIRILTVLFPPAEELDAAALAALGAAVAHFHPGMRIVKIETDR